MRHIEEAYADRPDDLLFFRACVEAHNAKIMEEAEEGSETEEGGENEDSELLDED